MQYVVAAARNIGQRMLEPKIVVDKSTVPVGTADRVRAVIAEELAARGMVLDFAVASNPEFLKEGAAVDDFMRPDRVVIGADDERAVSTLRTLYAPFMRSHDRFLVMDVRSAELTKYAANAMLATRISFMNEIANLADAVGADIEMVRKGIGSDPRIGYHFLYPGVGYGGSCFPKDVKALQYTANEYGRPLELLGAVEAVNERQKRVLVDKIQEHFGSDLAGRTFALWGLAFKPNTDDMREAPSRVIIDALAECGARVVAYDPVAMTEARRVYAGAAHVAFVSSPLAACDGADALIIATEWQEFRSPDFLSMKARLRAPLIFDGRNLYDPRDVQAAGFDYFAIGRR
jgi:UDPglucose 6-dehydrogenase